MLTLFMELSLLFEHPQVNFPLVHQAFLARQPAHSVLRLGEINRRDLTLLSDVHLLQPQLLPISLLIGALDRTEMFGNALGISQFTFGLDAG